ncbi:ester cyclase (plasmid) [Embleya sp. NBC_00888]|uniref:ester cyclase n=1 Tax=Embleya sp. NBC_00888 TaxID=2975960 RepID=UPI002F90E84A|nr:ester cyclase [Embleya sp. NBC_00888]
MCTCHWSSASTTPAGGSASTTSPASTPSNRTPPKTRCSLHNDDEVWVRLRMQGRHSGAFVLFKEGAVDQVVPPTGREIDFEQIHVLDLRDGKVIRHKAIRDDVTMLGQLGVFPPTPAAGMRMLAWRATGRAARAGSVVTTQAAQAAATVTHMPTA